MGAVIAVRSPVDNDCFYFYVPLVVKKPFSIVSVPLQIVEIPLRVGPGMAFEEVAKQDVVLAWGLDMMDATTTDVLEEVDAKHISCFTRVLFSDAETIYTYLDPVPFDHIAPGFVTESKERKGEVSERRAKPGTDASSDSGLRPWQHQLRHPSHNIAKSSVETQSHQSEAILDDDVRSNTSAEDSDSMDCRLSSCPCKLHVTTLLRLVLQGRIASITLY
eukprot:5153077-Amphidinium_carterae.1